MEFMAKIFYKEEEIKEVIIKQQQDLFEEIVELKREAVDDAKMLCNKIDISCFAPKPVVTTGMTKLKTAKFNRKQKSLLLEDENMDQSQHASWDII